MPVLNRDGEPDVDATYQRGKRQMREAVSLGGSTEGGEVDGMFASALEDFTWFWRHALEHKPSMVGVRGSFLLGRLVELAEHYEPAQGFLDAEISRLTGSVQAGEVSRREFYDLLALLRALERYADFGAAFDTLSRSCPALADEVGVRCWRMFVRCERIDLFRAHAPEPLEIVEQQRQILATSSGPDVLPADVLEDIRGSRWRASERTFEGLARAYVDAGLDQEAEQLEAARRELSSWWSS